MQTNIVIDIVPVADANREITEVERAGLERILEENHVEIQARLAEVLESSGFKAEVNPG